MLFIYKLGAWSESMLFANSTVYEFTVSILKHIISQTDLYMYSVILTPKTHVFEDKVAKYQSV